MTDNHTNPDLIEPTDEWMKEHGFVPVDFVNGYNPDDGTEYYWMMDYRGLPNKEVNYRIGGSPLDESIAPFLACVEQVAAIWKENSSYPPVTWMLTVEAHFPGSRRDGKPMIPFPRFWIPGESGVSRGEWMELNLWDRNHWYGPYGSVTYFLPMLKSFLRERGWM